VERGPDQAAAVAVPEGAVVVVPVKAFSQAKMRLAPVLSPVERADLARRMATRVLAAARPLPVVVVCDDLEVSRWAQELGARVLAEPGLGLNGAVSTARSLLESEGYQRLIVAHGDLPLVNSLAWLADLDGIVLVPDRHLEGTNVLSIPAGSRFRFAYGPGSFVRHQDEARRTGLPWRVVHDAELAWDVDSPADMAAVAL